MNPILRRSITERGSLLAIKRRSTCLLESALGSFMLWGRVEAKRCKSKSRNGKRPSSECAIKTLSAFIIRFSGIQVPSSKACMPASALSLWSYSGRKRKWCSGKVLSRSKALASM